MNSLTFNNAPFQIIGDGQFLALIIKQLNGEQIAYVFKDPAVRSFTTSIGHEMYEHSCGFFADRIMVPVSMICEAEIGISAANIEVRTGDDLMFDLDILHNRTVRELFALINKKLDKRVK